VDAYISNTSFSAVGDRIRAAKRIALCTHTRPDGDAIGSVLAVARALEGDDVHVDIFLMGPIEAALREIAGPTPYRHVETDPPDDSYDLVIVADTGSWTQLEPLEEWLRKHRDKVIGIDHHVQGDDVAALRIVDPTAASATQIITALLDEMGCEVTGEIGGVGEAIFVGLATDTGWFRYSNAGPEAFQLAARLLEAGVDRMRLFQLIEEAHRPVRLALEALALASVEYARGGSVAIQSLALEDFARTGGSVEDLTGVVNLPMIVGEVRVSILLAECEPGLTKMSFRAKPPRPGDDPRSADVNVLAGRFGGGGHLFASGARLRCGLDQARDRLRAELA